MPSNVIQEASWPNKGRGPVSNGAGPTAAAAAAGIRDRDATRGPDGELTLLSTMGEVVHVATPPVTESIRYMLARLRLDGAELPKRLGVTSALRGEGVTYITRSLALVLASDASKNVCIVDLNWAAPSEWVGDQPQIGAADVLR